MGGVSVVGGTGSPFLGIRCSLAYYGEMESAGAADESAINPPEEILEEVEERENDDYWITPVEFEPEDQEAVARFVREFREAK
ncbi:MAG: hypothetical protein ACRDTD_26220 [Pseudonocardiaceae bacterium]